MLGRLAPLTVKHDIRYLMLELYGRTWGAMTENPTDEAFVSDMAQSIVNFPKAEILTFSVGAQSTFRSGESEELIPVDSEMFLGNRVIDALYVEDEMKRTFAELKEEHPEWKLPIISVVEMERAA